MKPSPASSTVEDLLRNALADLDAGRLDASHAALVSARALAPDNPRVHYALGLYYGDTMQFADALKAIDESLRLDAGHAKAHNNRGSMLMQLGRWDDAEHAFRRALELEPALTQPYLNLGQVLEHRGAIDAAGAIYALAIDRGQDREMFEQCRAALLGRETRASPESWVRSTFDNFAPTFDARLRSLRYRVPQDLASRLIPRLRGPADILDLGCGTGTCGIALAGQKRRLVGVDLSAKMLQQAALRGLYDELHEAEVQHFLAGCAPDTFDVVIAADVFIYIGELDAVFRYAARALRPLGHFAFSIEEAEGRDYALRPTGRYAQAQAYVRRLASSDFDVRCAEATVIRDEPGDRVMGRLYVLQKRAAQGGR